MKKILIDEQEFTKLIKLNNFTNEELADYYNCSISVVKSRVKEFNLLGLRNTNIIQQKYTCNYDFFKVPNNINSYWAGLIAADGCIKNRNRSQKVLNLGLDKKDHNIIEKFKKAIQYTGPIRTERNLSVIDICSDKLCVDLKTNFNITSKKSWTLKPPVNLNKEESYYFIKGYIDGDGSIIKYKPHLLRLQILGTLDMLQWIRDIFVKNFNVNKKTIYKLNNNITYAYILSGHKDCMKCLPYLFNLKGIHMNRKWNNVGDFINA